MNYSTIAKLIGQYILPPGFLVFLTFLCIIESRSGYHTQLYLLTSLPALIISIIQPKLVINALQSTTFKLSCLLCAFALISTLWNKSEVVDFREIRYIINIILFSLAITYIHHYRQGVLEKLVFFAAAVWAGVGLLELYTVYYQQGRPLSSRIVGSGSLSNPLLSSHVYGAFATFIASHYLINNIQLRSKLLYLVIFLSLMIFIVQTHSRTPLLALFAVCACLLLKHRNKQVAYAVLFLLALLAIYATFNYSFLIERGLSYRPDIWLAAFKDIQSAPIIGHGIGTEMFFFIPSLNTTFSDSHNVHISLIYQLGITGIIIWLTLIAYLFRLYLKNTHNSLISTGFPMLIYGVTAGMTEGGSFFSRPKEVWFLTWLPIAMLAAAEIHQQSQNNNDKH